MRNRPAAVTPEAQTSEYVDEWWLLRHQAKLEEVEHRKDSIDLLMIGDSITQGWEDKENLGLWQAYFEPRKSLNLGYSGDRTEQVLWRLQNGEIDGLTPKVTTLLIGTNNTGHRQDPAKDTAAGVHAILRELQERVPKTSIVLHAIFPCGESPSDPLRRLNAEVSDIITGYTNGDSVRLFDIGEKFVDDAGRLDTDLMPDLLHLSPAGYRIWAESLVPLVDELLA